jgi:hypothetical protein
MESDIMAQIAAGNGTSQKPPTAIVIDPSHTVPPMPLNSQLADVWQAERLTPSTLGLKAKVSTDTILRIEYGGKGTLASFCKVMVVLERGIDIRTWEYRQLLPPENTSDPKALCRALSEYRLHLSRSGLSWYPWGMPTENRRFAVENAEPNVSLKAFQEYAGTVAVHCSLVPVVW